MARQEAGVALERGQQLADLPLRVAPAQPLLRHHFLGVVRPAFGVGVALEQLRDPGRVAVHVQEMQEVAGPHLVHGGRQQRAFARRRIAPDPRRSSAGRAARCSRRPARRLLSKGPATWMYAKFCALYGGASSTSACSGPGIVTSFRAATNSRSSGSCLRAPATAPPGGLCEFALSAHSRSVAPGAYAAHDLAQRREVAAEVGLAELPQASRAARRPARWRRSFVRTSRPPARNPGSRPAAARRTSPRAPASPGRRRR